MSHMLAAALFIGVIIATGDVRYATWGAVVTHPRWLSRMLMSFMLTCTAVVLYYPDGVMKMHEVLDTVGLTDAWHWLVVNGQLLLVHLKHPEDMMEGVRSAIARVMGKDEL